MSSAATIRVVMTATVIEATMPLDIARGSIAGTSRPRRLERERATIAFVAHPNVTSNPIREKEDCPHPQSHELAVRAKVFISMR
jgi:hypothetical protein